MCAELSTERLQQIVAGVLEDAAFIFTEPAEGELPWPEEVMTGVVSFSGPTDGELWLAAPGVFCEELAANLLGVEVDDEGAAAQSRDAIGELLNVIGGVLLEARFGSQSICMLSAPVVTVKPAAEVRGLAASCRTSLLADEEHRIDAALIEQAGG